MRVVAGEIIGGGELGLGGGHGKSLGMGSESHLTAPFELGKEWGHGGISRDFNG